MILFVKLDPFLVIWVGRVVGGDGLGYVGGEGGG